MSNINILSIENERKWYNAIDAMFSYIDGCNLNYVVDFKKKKASSVSITWDEIETFLIHKSYDIVIVDMNLLESSVSSIEGDLLGLEVLQRLRSKYPKIIRVVVTIRDDQECNLRNIAHAVFIKTKSFNKLDIVKTTIHDLVKKNLLFLTANPKETLQLDTSKEFEVISNMTQNSNIRCFQEKDITLTSLKASILKYSPKFVHISAHGSLGNTVDRETALNLGIEIEKDSGIILDNGYGEKEIVQSEKLDELFNLLSQEIEIELVFLNACFSENQANVISTYIPYVIGTKSIIKDSDAIKFSEVFYSHLAKGDSIEIAFAYASAETKKVLISKTEDIAILIKRGELK